jgi:hypothetical protein
MFFLQKTTLFLFVFCLVSSVSAQVSIGLRGGTLRNQIAYSGDNALQDSIYNFSKNRSGTLLGLVIETRVNNGFAIQTGVEWAQRGGRIDLKDNVLTLTAKSNTLINYVDIPVLIKAGFGVGPIRLDLLGGPSFGYALDGRTKSMGTLGGTVLYDTTDDLFEDGDNYRRWQVQAQTGAVLSLTLGNTAFFADGRYLYGLTDLTQDDEGQYHFRGAAFTGGLLFRL